MNTKSTYICDNCGAEINLKKYEHVKECSYCGNLLALVDSNVSDKGLNKMLPFELELEEVPKILKILKYKNSVILEKIYIPFYVCDFDMVYYAHYYRTTGSGDNETTIEYKDFIDGSVKKYFSMAVKELDGKIIGLEYLKKDKIINYDPLIVGQHKVAQNDFIYYENVIEKVSNEVGLSIICGKGSSTYILSSDCTEINEDVDVVLVPFYKVKTQNSDVIYLLGQNMYKELNRQKIARTVAIISILTAFILFPFLYLNSWQMPLLVKLIFFISLAIFIVIIFTPKKKNKDIDYKHKRIYRKVRRF